MALPKVIRDALSTAKYRASKNTQFAGNVLKANLTDPNRYKRLVDTISQITTGMGSYLADSPTRGINLLANLGQSVPSPGRATPQTQLPSDLLANLLYPKQGKELRSDTYADPSAYKAGGLLGRLMEYQAGASAIKGIPAVKSVQQPIFNTAKTTFGKGGLARPLGYGIANVAEGLPYTLASMVQRKANKETVGNPLTDFAVDLGIGTVAGMLPIGKSLGYGGSLGELDPKKMSEAARKAAGEQYKKEAMNYYREQAAKKSDLFKKTREALTSTENRPAHQVLLEQAANAGDYKKVGQILDSIPDTDPYKATMEHIFRKEVPTDILKSEKGIFGLGADIGKPEGGEEETKRLLKELAEKQEISKFAAKLDNFKRSIPNFDSLDEEVQKSLIGDFYASGQSADQTTGGIKKLMADESGGIRFGSKVTIGKDIKESAEGIVTPEEVAKPKMKSFQLFTKKAPEVAEVTAPRTAVEAVTGVSNVKTAVKESVPSNMPDEDKQLISDFIEELNVAKKARTSYEGVKGEIKSSRYGSMKSIAESSSGESGFRMELSALKGKYPDPEYEGLRKVFTQDKVDRLLNIAKESPNVEGWDNIPARLAVIKILDGDLPTDNELRMAGKVYGKEFVDGALELRPSIFKWAENGFEILNTPRTMMASFDMSFPLRQGVYLAVTHPLAWLKSFKGMHRDFFSEKAFTESQEAIFNDPMYKYADAAGLQLTDISNIKGLREESFPISTAERIPGIKIGVEASNRAYVGFANKFRFDVFKNLAVDLDALDKPDRLFALADFVNTGTGRASLGALEKHAVLLNSLFFSPRLIASRLKLLSPTYYAKLDPAVRKEAIKSTIAFAAAQLTMLGLLKYAGSKTGEKVDVGTDPTSADFGDIKMGNTRLDTTGGFSQYLRFFAQMATGKYTSSTTGKAYTLGEGFKPMTRKDIMERFGIAKLAPSLTLGYDVMKGSTYAGEPLTFENTVLSRFTPLFLGDLAAVMAERNLLVGGLSTVASFYGWGSQTYGNTFGKTTTGSYGAKGTKGYGKAKGTKGYGK